MTFWLVALLITLVIAAIGFYPLLKQKNRISQTERDQLNKAFYFDRLNEVEKEANEGVIEDAEQTKLELQQSLLDDIPAETQDQVASQKRFGKGTFAALLVAVSAISVGAYWQVGSWQAADMVNMTHQKLTYFYERIKSEDTNPLSEAELNQFAIALRTDLQNNPQNAKGWFMLGQIGMAKEDGQLAYESYGKAAQLEPENLQYQSTYAQLLMTSNTPADKEQGKKLLKEILRKDHTNLDALSLLAFSAFEEEDYKMAAMTWGMMLKLIPEEDPRRKTVEKSVDMAMQMMKMQEEKAAPSTAEPQK
ncbi:cytochrome c-type biogenesis protein CcmI [Haemophilus sputorum HK 2154]|uniref:c-type cytochrome biogenesis protein CcmI n=1 Tax=Haemophilus sputorum TaxID=1078480 RepID=UPI00027A53CD|nr:c-type cytochrome biogenesis protein CcmI [Haemophilus sputorum]EJP27114.1 cytochrome c-type biogenesis protein CcmI [Haemophilus sputorum HK 2154]